MQKKEWWQKPLNIIQYNLQIMDTPEMQPEQIAEDAKNAGANAVVLNVGGIYAWYESRIKFHHRNEFIPEGKKLLEEILWECHKRNIHVIGRFDFSKADDVVFLQHPEWFVKTAEGEPVVYGGKRMGRWTLLMSTCINSGYRKEEFAEKVLEEAIGMLEIDGIFFNAPHMEECWCENCRKKYSSMYHTELPLDKNRWENEWKLKCLNENMELLYRKIKTLNPKLPVIIYYNTYNESGMKNSEHLDEKYMTADLLCTEAQDILSVGKTNLPYRWKPTLNMKLGEMLENSPQPLGIIHSCPGMDWRHTGLPTAEHEYWMSQIPASGGQLWHSLTGFNETITDKRMIKAVTRVNRKALISNQYMEDARELVDAVLLWDGKKKELAMAKALLECHIAFRFMDLSMLDLEQLGKCPAVVLADGIKLKEEQIRMIQEYTAQGGKVIVEKTDITSIENFCELIGIRKNGICEEMIQAAYGEFQEEFQKQCGIENQKYIPIRGNYLYVRPNPDTRTVMTLIPPFAPADGVGAPPERASLVLKHTDVPAVLINQFGKGQVLGVFFELAEQIEQIGLADQKAVLENLFEFLTSDRKWINGSRIPDGVILNVWEKGRRRMIQIVNGIGERPLKDTIPCENLELWMKTQKECMYQAYSVLENNEVKLLKESGGVRICIKKVTVWDLIVVEEVDTEK